MAGNPSIPDLPANLQKLVKAVGRPVTSADIDSYGKLRDIEDRSHRLRTIVKAWKDQRTQDRALRQKYAHWLIVGMAAQAVAVNAVFVAIGTGRMAVEEWTARIFIIAVFGEIAGMVLLVVKYLFTPASESILKYLDPPSPKER